MPKEKHYKDKVCRMCGKTFTPLSPNGKWCVDCRDKANKEREKAYREQFRAAKPEDNTLHTCDSPEKVKKCLNCTRGGCNGWCEDVADTYVLAKRKYREKKLQESIERVAHFIRSGARESFIMRELGISKNQFTRWKNIAIEEGLLPGGA